MSDLSLVSNGEGWLTESKRIWGNNRQRTSAMVINVCVQCETVFTAIAAQSRSTAGTGERFSSLPRVLDWRVTVDSSGSPVMLDFRSVRLAPKRWPHLLLVHADLKTTTTERGWVPSTCSSPRWREGWWRLSPCCLDLPACPWDSHFS